MSETGVTISNEYGLVLPVLWPSGEKFQAGQAPHNTTMRILNKGTHFEIAEPSELTEQP